MNIENELKNLPQVDLDERFANTLLGKLEQLEKPATKHSWLDWALLATNAFLVFSLVFVWRNTPLIYKSEPVMVVQVGAYLWSYLLTPRAQNEGETAAETELVFALTGDEMRLLKPEIDYKITQQRLIVRVKPGESKLVFTSLRYQNIISQLSA